MLGIMHQRIHGALQDHAQQITHFQGRVRNHIKLLFLSLHPWTKTKHFSIRIPRSIRMMLLTVQFITALAASVVFFTFSGSASPIDSPDECKTQGFWDQLGRDILVSMISSLFSSGVPMLMKVLHTRKFVHVQKEGSPKWYAVLFVWRFLDVLLWVMMVGWVVLCAIIIMIFLASSTPMDGSHWLATATLALLQWLLLTPLIFSAILALSYELFARMSEDYEEIVHLFLGLEQKNSRENTQEDPDPVLDIESRQRAKPNLIGEVFP